MGPLSGHTSILFQGVSGATLQFETAPETRVLQLRRHVSQEWEVPLQCLRLVLGTTLLDDDAAVWELSDGTAPLHVTVVAKKRHATCYRLDIGAKGRRGLLRALQQAGHDTYAELLASAEHGDVIASHGLFRNENVVFVCKDADGDVRLVEADCDDHGHPVIPAALEAVTEFPHDYWEEMEWKGDYHPDCDQWVERAVRICRMYDGFVAAAAGAWKDRDGEGRPCIKFVHRGQEYHVLEVNSLNELQRRCDSKRFGLHWRGESGHVEVMLTMLACDFDVAEYDMGYGKGYGKGYGMEREDDKRDDEDDEGMSYAEGYGKDYGKNSSWRWW